MSSLKQQLKLKSESTDDKEIYKRLLKEVSKSFNLPNYELNQITDLYALIPHFQHPYVYNLLLNSTHKIKPEELMLPFIFYHESNSFFQLCKQLEFPSLYFLCGLKVPLQRSNLVCVLHKSCYLLEKILDMIYCCLENGVYCNEISCFYVKTFVEYCEKKDSTEYRMVLFNLIKIAKLNNLHIDMKAALLIVLSNISKYIIISKELFNLVQQILIDFLNQDPSCFEMCFFTINLFYQNHYETIGNLDPTLSLLLTNQKDFTNYLKDFSIKFKCSDFIYEFTISITTMLFKKQESYLIFNELLTTNLIQKHQMKSIIDLFFKEWIVQYNSYEPNWLPKTLSMIQNRYPKILAETIQNQHESNQSNEFSLLFERYFSNSIYEPFQYDSNQNSTTLYIALNNHEEIVRYKAIESFCNLLGNEYLIENEHIILERLYDTSSRIIEKIISIKSIEMLCLSIEFGQRLLNIIMNTVFDLSIRLKCIQILLKCFSRFDGDEKMKCMKVLFSFMNIRHENVYIFRVLVEDYCVLFDCDFELPKRFVEMVRIGLNDDELLVGYNAIVFETSAFLRDANVFDMFLELVSCDIFNTFEFGCLVLDCYFKNGMGGIGSYSSVSGVVFMKLGKLNQVKNVKNQKKEKNIMKEKIVKNVKNVKKQEDLPLCLLNLSQTLLRTLPVQKIEWNTETINNEYLNILRKWFQFLLSNPSIQFNILFKDLTEYHLSKSILSILFKFIHDDHLPSVITSLKLIEMVVYQVGIDFQICLPFLMPLIVHSNPSVRGSLLNVLGVFSKCYHDSIDQGFTDDSIHLYSKNTFPNIENIQLVSFIQIKKHLDTILKHKKEIIMDGSVYLTMTSELFNSTSIKTTKQDPIFILFMDHLKYMNTSSQTLFLSLFSKVTNPLLIVSLLPFLDTKLKEINNPETMLFFESFLCLFSKFQTKHEIIEIHEFVMNVLSIQSTQLSSLMLMNFPIQYYKKHVSIKKQSLLLTLLIESSFSNETGHIIKTLIRNMNLSWRVYFEQFKIVENGFDMKVLIYLLEVVSEIEGYFGLIESFFNVLDYLGSVCEPFCEYAKQLVIGCIHNVLISQYGNDDTITNGKTITNGNSITKSSSVNSNLVSLLRVDVLVHTLRTSTNPSTQTLVLLVLSKIAQHNPDLVITNILPIFTFMGTILLQDDDYTYHVITKTLSMLMPHLQDNLDEFLDLFIDALPNLPKHRRLKLFELIISFSSLSSVLNKLLINHERMSISLCLNYSNEIILNALVDMIRIENLEFIETLLLNKMVKNKKVGRQVVLPVLEKVYLIMGHYPKGTFDKLVVYLNDLIILDDFIGVCKVLLNHCDVGIRNQCLDVLGKRVESVIDGNEELIIKGSAKGQLNKDKDSTPNDSTSLNNTALLFSDVLVDLVQILSSQTNSPETKQYALITVSSMIKSFALSDLDHYLEFFDVAILLFKQNNENVNISCLAMISLLTCKAGPRSLPTLSKIMPFVFDLFNSQNEMQLLGVICYLNSLLETIPNFSSPYIKTILEKMFTETVLDYSNKPQPIPQQIHEKTQHLFQLFLNVPIRIILPCLFNFYATNLSEPQIIPYFNCLKNVLTILNKSDLQEWNMKLHTFFLRVFETFTSTPVYDAYTVYILKLNESLFKPHFIKLNQWGKSNPSLFYKTLSHLFKILGSIFVPWFNTNIINQSMNDMNENEDMCMNILDCIHSLFIHSTEIEINTCQIMIEPLSTLIYQFESTETKKSQLILNIFIEMCCSQQEPLWKKVNYQIQLFSKCENRVVKLFGMMLLKGIYERIGDSFLVLLPETIPFLAELMEDEDEEVEKSVRGVCRIVESYLGEDIQHYFNA